MKAGRAFLPCRTFEIVGRRRIHDVSPSVNPEGTNLSVSIAMLLPTGANLLRHRGLCRNRYWEFLKCLEEADSSAAWQYRAEK